MATIVITGANRGIGLELTKQYHQRGDKVIGVCRQSSPQLDQVATQIQAGVDITRETDVAQLAEQLANTNIDVVINNAGLLQRTSLSHLDFDAMRRQFEVNSLAPLRVSAALIPRMVRGGKIAIITSRMGSIADNGSGGSYGYRMSKAAVNIAGVSLARDLKSQGIAVALLHPGFVKTDMTGGQGNTTPDRAAADLIDRIDELALSTSGQFWHASGELLPW